jgi:anti-sigma factor RsiW
MSEYVDGELSTRQRRRIGRHADECPECGPLRRSLTRLVAELNAMRAISSGRTELARAVIQHVRDADEREEKTLT